MDRSKPRSGDTACSARGGEPLDRDFSAYCGSGDPQLLAQVFDASAGKLLQLALHLASSEAAAEDLVQQTFLRIIERSSTFEAGRRFLPWAATILQNEARSAFRQAKRRRRLPGRPPPELRDAAELAQECEALDALGDALQRLPLRYREVLRLKLLEGFDNGDIAQRLGLQAETVRTRVHRGLQRLRPLLPAGIAGLALVLLHGRGLAQVRDRVLERARDIRPLTRMSGGSGWWSWMGVAALFGGVLALVVWASSQPAAAPLGSAAAVPQAGSAGATVAAETVVGAVVREPLPNDLTGADWQLHGQVHRVSGQPIPGAEVCVTLVWGCEAQRLPPVATDQEGRYRLDVGALRKMGRAGLLAAQIQVQAWAPGCRPSEIYFVDQLSDLLADRNALATDRIFVADLRLQAGHVLRARIVAPGGQPLRGLVSAAIPRLETEGRGSGARHQELAADGLLRLPLPPPGAARLRVSGIQGVLDLPLPAARGADLDLGQLELRAGAVLRARLMVQGQVGFPYAYYEIRRPGRAPLRGRAGAGGAIHHPGLEPGAYHLAVRNRGGAAQVFEVFTDRLPRDLRVAGQLLTVQIEDSNGRPAPGVMLRSRPLGFPQAEQIHDVRFRPGRYHLLLPVGTSWSLKPMHWLIESVARQHRVIDGQVHARLRLQVHERTDLGRLDLQVMLPDGRSANGAELRLDLPTRPALDPEASLERLRRGVPAGLYQLTVSQLGFLPQQLLVDILPGSLLQRQLRLERGAQLELLLTGPGPRRQIAQLGEIENGHWWPRGRLLPVAREGGPEVSVGELLRPEVALRPGRRTLQVRAGRLRSEPVEVELRRDRAQVLRLEMRGR